MPNISTYYNNCSNNTAQRALSRALTSPELPLEDIFLRGISFRGDTNFPKRWIHLTLNAYAGMNTVLAV